MGQVAKVVNTVEESRKLLKALCRAAKDEYSMPKDEFEKLAKVGKHGGGQAKM